MVILDANMILRYLLNDNQEMADKTEQYLDSGDAAITIEVIAEVVYVLKGINSMERETIANTIREFLDLTDCRDIDVLGIALETYGDRNLDFVDCVLFGYHKSRGINIATFDKKLLKLLADS